jgi:O-antigen/teichoic acid export membrane protein
VSQLVRNVLSGYAARAVAVCGALFLFPYVTHQVGMTHFGIWLLVSSITFFFMTADFGMGTSVIRYVADARARDDDGEVDRVISSTLAFFAVIGVAAAALFALFFAAFWGSFDIPDGDRDLAAWIVAIVAVAHLALFLPLNVFRQVLIGLGRMDVANGLQLLQALLRLGAIVAVLQAGLGIVGVAAAEAAVLLVVALIAVRACVAQLPRLELRPRHVSVALLRSMLPYSAGVFVMGLSGLVVLQTDNAVIGLFMPVAAVTLYAGAFRIYQVARDVTQGLMHAVVPDASRAGALGDRERLRALLVRGTKWGNAAILLLAIPAMAFAEPVLVHWLGPRFDEAAVVVWLLLASLLLNNNHMVAVGLLTGLGRIRALVRYHVIWAVANLAIALALTPLIGLEGVALGTLVPLLVLEPLYVRTALRELGLPAAPFLREAVLRPYAAALPAVALLLAIVATGRPWQPLAVLAASAAFAVAYAASFWLLGMDRREHERVLRWLPAGRREAVA